MLKKIQQDFSYYSHEFKDNYRKGVHRLRTILASRAQAQAFVSNAGGVAVVLGYEPETPDKNAQELYALLAASPYIDDAVQTFLGSIYEAGAESQDALYSDSARCLEILHDPVMARAAGAGAVSAGKWIAALAGQSCDAYRDITAVAASATAMNAVAANSPAVAASSTAMAAVAASDTAMKLVTASAMCLAKFIGSNAAKTALIDHNDMLQKYRAAIWTAVTGGTDYFTSQRGQKDDDGVTNADITNAAYIMFAIPGGYNSGSGVTVCCHGHNGKEAARASGSYSDNNKRYVLLGGGTFTEVNDGMVRTWVYKTK